jgi:hypothetical protein
MARHPDKAPDLGVILRRIPKMGRGKMVNIFFGDDGVIQFSMQRSGNTYASAVCKPEDDPYQKLLECIGPGFGKSWAEWLGTKPEATAAPPEADPSDEDDDDDFADLI